ncbi:hypothetical protein P9112_000866 [Eukaryota sp. TZLM1-RC]
MVGKIEPSLSGFKPDPLIQFKSMTTNQNLPTVMCFDLETYQDGHLYQNHDGQFLPPNQIINNKRKEGANLLKKKTDEQICEWISDQKVFLISIVIGKFDRRNFFLESKYSLLLRMSPQIRLPDIDMDIQAEIFSDEKTLLRRFINLIGNHQPHCFLNHNLMQFDLQVLKNRLNYFDLAFPTVRDDSTIDVLNQLSPRWREVVIRENGFSQWMDSISEKEWI